MCACVQASDFEPIEVRGFPARGCSIPGRGGMGVWAAQEIQCRRRVARPPVHFRKMGASRKCFWHKSTPYERSRSIYECIMHDLLLRIFWGMTKFEDSS